MIVRSMDEVNDTDADIKTENWRSRRIVLAKEKVEIGRASCRERV